jgi:hypothetical protein
VPKKPKMRAFRAFDFVSRPSIFSFQARICQKSPAVSAKIPVLWRFSGETSSSELPPDYGTLPRLPNRIKAKAPWSLRGLDPPVLARRGAGLPATATSADILLGEVISDRGKIECLAILENDLVGAPWMRGPVSLRVAYCVGINGHAMNLK